MINIPDWQPADVFGVRTTPGQCGKICTQRITNINHFNQGDYTLLLNWKTLKGQREETDVREGDTVYLPSSALLSSMK